MATKTEVPTREAHRSRSDATRKWVDVARSLAPLVESEVLQANKDSIITPESCSGLERRRPVRGVAAKASRGRGCGRRHLHRDRGGDRPPGRRGGVGVLQPPDWHVVPRDASERRDLQGATRAER